VQQRPGWDTIPQPIPVERSVSLSKGGESNAEDRVRGEQVSARGLEEGREEVEKG